MLFYRCLLSSKGDDDCAMHEGKHASNPDNPKFITSLLPLHNIQPDLRHNLHSHSSLPHSSPSYLHAKKETPLSNPPAESTSSTHPSHLNRKSAIMHVQSLAYSSIENTISPNSRRRRTALARARDVAVRLPSLSAHTYDAEAADGGAEGGFAGGLLRGGVGELWGGC